MVCVDWLWIPRLDRVTQCTQSWQQFANDAQFLSLRDLCLWCLYPCPYVLSLVCGQAKSALHEAAARCTHNGLDRIDWTGALLSLLPTKG